MTPVTESGLMRMMLNPAVAGTVVPPTAALASLRSLRDHPRARDLLPDDSSLAQASVDLIGLVGHRQVTDFHLVNLAARHGMRLVTFDAKLGRTLGPDAQQLVSVLG